MLQLRRLIITLLLVLSVVGLKAQNSEVMLGVRAGDYAALGGFAAVSLEISQALGKGFGVNGGVQYNTIGKSSVDARPSYSYDLAWGRLSAELLLNYANFLSAHNFAAGTGVGLSSRWVDGKLGYYYRLYGSMGSRIAEPFNIYYEICANLLPMIENWDLQIVATNTEIFELERHYQPSFLAQCRYDHGEHLGILFGVGCKPAGMFNLSAEYYQSFVKVGVCYRW